MGQQKEAEIMRERERERKYKHSEIVSRRKKQKVECKKITQIEKALKEQKNGRSPTEKRQKNKLKSGRDTTVSKEKKHILGETINSGSHKKESLASL